MHEHTTFASAGCLSGTKSLLPSSGPSSICGKRPADGALAFDLEGSRGAQVLGHA